MSIYKLADRAMMLLATALTACGGGGNGQAQCTLTAPLCDIASVEVMPAAATLSALGDTVRFTAVAKDASGTIVSGGGLAITWTSSSSSVATIDATGLARAVGNGSATITASVAVIDSTRSASLTVDQVASAQTSLVSVSRGTVPVGSNAIFTLSARDANDSALTTGGDSVAFSLSGGTSTGTLSTTTDNNDGTYQATFTGTAEGTALTVGATLNSVAVVTQLPTITVTGQFATPDILDASFETGWDGFKDGGTGDPNGPIQRSQAQAFFGTWSVERTIIASSTSEQPANMTYDFGAQDDIWVRVYFRFEGPPPSREHKFVRFHLAGFNGNLGGVFTDGRGGTPALKWGFDAEVQAQLIGIGVPTITQGVWHCLEWNYRRNGDAFPSVAFWYDGNVTQGSGPPAPASWINGRLVAGERGATGQIQTMNISGIVNITNNNASALFIDGFAISTRGRIGC